MEQKTKFFSKQLLVLLAAALVIASAPAVSANAPAIAQAFPEVAAVYMGPFTTIPALFLISRVLAAHLLEQIIGGKTTMLVGLALVAVFGTLPAWYQQTFSIPFLSRCLLGLGLGLFNRLLLQWLSGLYQIDFIKKARVLGLESACEGLVGIFMTLSVGQLMKISWSVSFFIYSLVLIGFVLIACFVAKQAPFSQQEDNFSHVPVFSLEKGKIIQLGNLLFLIVLLFIHYNLQIPPFSIANSLGNATSGSNLIAVIAVGAFASGNLFSKLYQSFRNKLLPSAVLLAGLSIGITSLSSSLVVALLCAASVSFAFRTIMPYILYLVTTRGETTAKLGTTVVLIAYNLGTTIAPGVALLFKSVAGSISAAQQLALAGILMSCLGVGLFVAEGFICRKWRHKNGLY